MSVINKKKLTIKKEIAVLLFIIFAGGILRLVHLGSNSLWNDELDSWWRSSTTCFSTVINKVITSDMHPPGYHSFLYFIERYIGDSEYVLRFPSLIAGILAIYLIFLIGRLLYSSREGLISAAFMAFLWAPIYYSQEARMYSFLLLVSLVTVYFWIKIIQSTALNIKIFSAYIISAITVSYLHYFGLFFVILQCIAALLISKNEMKRFNIIVCFYAAIFLAFVPWLPAMIYQLKNNLHEVNWIASPSPVSILDYFRFVFNRSDALLVFVAAFYFFWFFKVVRQVKEKNKILVFHSTLVCLAWLILPIAGAYIFSKLFVPIFNNRNLIISLPAAYLLLARAITQIFGRLKTQVIIVSLLIITFFAQLVYAKEYYTKPQKEQIKEAVNEIVINQTEYKDSLIIGYVWHEDFLNYYFKRLGSQKRIDINVGCKKDLPVIKKIIEKNNNKFIWFIFAHKTPDNELIDYLSKRLKLIKHKQFLGSGVWLFER